MSERRDIEPPPSLDPLIARFIAELAREAVRRQNREMAALADPEQRPNGASMPDDDRPALEDNLRNSAAREQAKHRRAKSEAVVAAITLEQLPLFADERSLSEAVLGRGKYTHWRAIIPLLERRGFPTIDGLMGGRYVPAVRAFFDREYRVHGELQVSKPHSRATFGAAHGVHGARRQDGKTPGQ